MLSIVRLFIYLGKWISLNTNHYHHFADITARLGSLTYFFFLGGFGYNLLVCLDNSSCGRYPLQISLLQNIPSAGGITGRHFSLCGDFFPLRTLIFVLLRVPFVPLAILFSAGDSLSADFLFSADFLCPAENFSFSVVAADIS